jgi:hypothetical protein
MAETYRLVFRGEVLEGQHRAVVKRRLSELLHLDDARVEKLFSGKPVLLKRGVDRDTAARYQAQFKQAGGRLRVQAEEAVPAEGASPPSAPARTADTAPNETRQPRRPGANRDIDAPEFTVLTAYFPPPSEPRAEIAAPDYGVAEVGANLLEPAPTAPPVVVDVDFELAEVGADLLVDPPEPVTVELGTLDFELAEPGADLAPTREPAAGVAPDISHLALVEV